MREIWFWQQIISPHMAGLARALAREGCKVTYVAERSMTDDRAKLGWIIPALDGVELRYATNRSEIARCVDESACGSIHLCQGLRSNGLVSIAEKRLAHRGLPLWVLMETVDDDGFLGVLKRISYAALFKWKRATTSGVLALGHRTADWVEKRGMPAELVFPFAYFLEDRVRDAERKPVLERPFRFAFVGRFIELKRFPMIVDALASLDHHMVELIVVGSGPLEESWRSYAEGKLDGCVRWMGGLPSAQVLNLLDDVDCLVLPSRYDGWGAVISEALMSGTPAICSDHCGAAGAVFASGVGGVFDRNNVAELAGLLARAISNGQSSKSDREKLALWARSLGAQAGARYLLEIFSHADGSAARPEAPWLQWTPKCAV